MDPSEHIHPHGAIPGLFDPYAQPELAPAPNVDEKVDDEDENDDDVEESDADDRGDSDMSHQGSDSEDSMAAGPDVDEDLAFVVPPVETFIERHHADAYRVGATKVEQRRTMKLVETYRQSYYIVSLNIEAAWQRDEDWTVDMPLEIDIDELDTSVAHLMAVRQFKNRHVVDIWTAHPRNNDYDANMRSRLGPPLSEGLSQEEISKRADAFAIGKIGWIFDVTDDASSRIEKLMAMCDRSRNESAKIIRRIARDYSQAYTAYEIMVHYNLRSDLQFQKSLHAAYLNMLRLPQLRCPLTPSAQRFFCLLAENSTLYKRQFPKYTRYNLIGDARKLLLRALDIHVVDELSRLYGSRGLVKARAYLVRCVPAFADWHRQRATLEQVRFAQRRLDPSVVPSDARAILPLDVIQLVEAFTHGLRVTTPITTRQDAIATLAAASSTLQALATQPPSAAVVAALGRVSDRMRRAAAELARSDVKRARNDD